MVHLPAQWGVVFDRTWVFAFLVPLIALVLLAHLLKARRVSIPVPSLIPWTRLKERAAPGARRKKRFSSRLLLQILFLGAAILAASGPWWSGEAPAPGTILVLFDRSASMNAPSDEGGSRLEAARRALAGLLADAPGDTKIRLRCLPPLSGGDLEFPAKDAGKRLKSVRPSDAPGSLSAMLQTRGGEDRTSDGVLIVSDGIGPIPPISKNARLLLVGGPCPNVGIEKFTVEGLEDGRFRVFLRVRNASPRSRSVPLEMRVGDRS
ncbi:MAG: vWA domain-containing protein, partial [Planctomycetota bacterium]